MGEPGISRAGASRANPVGNSVGRQRIVVKGDKSARAAIGSHARLAPRSHTAVPFLILSHPAAQKAEFALDSIRIVCGAGRQTEHLSGFGVNLVDSAPARIRPISGAGGTNPYAAGNVVQTVTAQEAFGLFPG